VNGPANKIRARLPILTEFARMLGLFNCRFQVETTAESWRFGTLRRDLSLTTETTKEGL
jgi:hypothetical protein